MIVKAHVSTPRPLTKPILYSAVIHIIVLITISIVPGIKLPVRDRPTRVVWVELPKGTSDEIGLGIKESKGLPKTTIEEQKALTPEMKPGQKAKPLPAEPKMTMPTTKPKVATKVKRRRRSSTDRKIANALAMLDKKVKDTGAPSPEAAQIGENSEGYKYGTGTEPLRVLPTDAEYLKYQAMVRARIIGQWVLPLKYVEEGHPRRNCAMEVSINMDGEVISTRWTRTSGDPTFDASAIRAVRRASPFPKPPDRLAWEAYNEGFLIEFDPSLKPRY